MVYYSNVWFVYEKTINTKFDGVRRKLYYGPPYYMKLHTSNGDVELYDRALQLYT